MERAMRVLLVVSGAYVAAQLLSDIASLRIISIGGYAVDAGTLIYPFTFTLRDLIHKVGGKTAARTMIWLAAVINLFMALFFWVVAWWPADPGVGPQLEFGQVLAPVWGIVVASIVAEVVAELIDTEVYSMWVRRFGMRRQWGRVLASNSVAIPIDSLIFVGLATWFGVFPLDVALNIFWLNVIIKGVVTVVSIPWIYLVKPQPLGSSYEISTH
ncbi:MAG: queuosine precursor transporter [Acidimicrobiia bacterium]